MCYIDNTGAQSTIYPYAEQFKNNSEFVQLVSSLKRQSCQPI